MYRLGSGLERGGARLDVCFEPPRKSKPLRFRNEGEIRLDDLSEMFRLSAARQGMALMKRFAEDQAFAKGISWDHPKPLVGQKLKIRMPTDG